MLGTLELHPWVLLSISQEYFGTISGNILNVIWWVHAGHMLRSQSGCTQNVIGGYIRRKMIQSPQFTQDVPTGFQVTSPPVRGWLTLLSSCPRRMNVGALMTVSRHNFVEWASTSSEDPNPQMCGKSLPIASYRFQSLRDLSQRVPMVETTSGLPGNPPPILRKSVISESPNSSNIVASFLEISRRHSRAGSDQAHQISDSSESLELWKLLLNSAARLQVCRSTSFLF